jgi:hypothetical protein
MQRHAICIINVKNKRKILTDFIHDMLIFINFTCMLKQ